MNPSRDGSVSVSSVTAVLVSIPGPFFIEPSFDYHHSLFLIHDNPFRQTLAMLAVMGFIASDFFRIPGDMYSFESIPNTIEAHDILLKTGPMYQLALWIGLFDILVTAPAVQAMGEGEREAGGMFHLLHKYFYPLDPMS